MYTIQKWTSSPLPSSARVCVVRGDAMSAGADDKASNCEEPPDTLLCPITYTLFKDPVRCVADGCVYERDGLVGFWRHRPPRPRPQRRSTRSSARTHRGRAGNKRWRPWPQAQGRHPHTPPKWRRAARRRRRLPHLRPSSRSDARRSAWLQVAPRTRCSCSARSLRSRRATDRCPNRRPPRCSSTCCEKWPRSTRGSSSSSPCHCV